MTIRTRMVLVGLVLGVLVAVGMASQGCSGAHHRHAGGGGTAVAAPPPPSVPAAHASRAVRHTDLQGPFFDARRGRIARFDPPRRAGREVALTFDDGPGPQTMQLLAELRRLHAKATFFVVGTMAAIRPAVVRAERRAGMEIGNHTWSHPILTTLRLHAQRVEIERGNLVLRKLTGRRPRFFRPPGWRIDPATARILSREGMVGVLRTVDTRDWTLPGVRAIVRSALGVRPGGIVAMHDAGGYTRTQTLEAVPYIVRGLRRRHLRLVTVAQLYAGRR